jgi:ATP-dependent helicase HrpB
VTDLPIGQILDQITASLMTHPRAVIIAPPGAGKTTIVPLALLDAPWRDGGRILMLEPRRLATRAAARRMAELLSESVGDTVGYQTREERRIGPDTVVEVVTEGILTRRIQKDPALTGIAAVIFDEVHERNLPTDIGLAFTLDAAAALRPDLRIIAMSATADQRRLPEVLAFQGETAPVLASEGRSYPVDLHWLPRTRDQRLEPAVVAAVQTALRDSGPDGGDLLVFLPGIGEIRRIQELLRAVLADNVDVVPLAGALSLAEQDHALAGSAPGRRRVVLSTDIAETSLTVEGVRIVIDSGLARAPRFDTGTQMTRLTTITTSRSSAEQRAGRAGRVAPGSCYRLWSKIEHGSRSAHPSPEITETDLAGLILEVAAWGSNIGDLPWIDPPPSKAVRAATEILTELGALMPGTHLQLTTIGEEMLGLPVHPRLARMIAAHPGSLACLVAAIIEERDLLRSAHHVTCDLGLRVQILAQGLAHDGADRGLIPRIIRQASEIAQRAQLRFDLSEIEPDQAGAVLLAAYPDRLAARRRPGQFQMRTGSAAMMDNTDPLATEEFIVAASLDGKRDRARIRLAAAVSAADVIATFGDQIDQSRSLVWDRDVDDLMEHTERRLGSMRLGITTGPPAPSEAVTEKWLQRIRSTGGAALPWGSAALELRARVEFLHRTLGEPWPDWSMPALLKDLDNWLAPYLVGITRRAEFEAVDLVMVLRSGLPWEVGADLDRLAPATFDLGRRSVPLDYSTDPPHLRARVQDLFGVTTHPQVAGIPVTVHLLSPADRPVQITSDLPGFWDGSWAAVRKEMAGRYPKHSWPIDPRSTP